MSDIIELKKIEAPLLDGNYGQNVKDTFNNINDNFTTLANHDFIKGENGETLYIKEVTLNTELINDIKIAIGANEDEGQDGAPIEITPDKKIGVYDNLKETDTIFLLYKGIDEKSKQPVSSLPFVFLDARYTKNFSEVADLSQYADKTDYSCVIIYENDTFKKLNSFPTLYYDNVLNTFAWKWQGSKTGMIARGPAGLNGKDGQLFTVNIDYEGGEKPYIINAFLDLSNDNTVQWIPAKDFTQEIHENAIAMVFDNTPADSTTYEYWVSPIKKDKDGNYYVAINNINKVELHYTAEMLKNILKNIDSTKTSNTDLSCLFIPIEKGNTISAHTIYTDANKKKLHIGSKTDINNILADGTSNVSGTSLNLDYESIQQNSCNASGKDSFAIGNKSTASGAGSFACGGYIAEDGDFNGGTASGKGSFAEGVKNNAIGTGSHAEGQVNTARGNSSHAEGFNNTISDTGSGAHVEGSLNIVRAMNGHAEGGENTIEETGEAGHAEGFKTIVKGPAGHAEGSETVVETTAKLGHAEGYGSIVEGEAGHAEGYYTNVSGNYGSHAEGAGARAIGDSSHAEGNATISLGQHSHAEGDHALASGGNSHAEGYAYMQITDTIHLFIPNRFITDRNDYFIGEHLIIDNTTVKITQIENNVGEHGKSHMITIDKPLSLSSEPQKIPIILISGSYGFSSHSEGYGTYAKGEASHAEGYNNSISTDNGHIEGQNGIDIPDAIHIVGIGKDETETQNAHVITTTGEHYIKGIGGYTGLESNLNTVVDLASVINGNNIEFKEVLDNPSGGEALYINVEDYLKQGINTIICYDNDYTFQFGATEITFNQTISQLTNKNKNFKVIVKDNYGVTIDDSSGLIKRKYDFKDTDTPKSRGDYAKEYIFIWCDALDGYFELIK